MKTTYRFRSFRNNFFGLLLCALLAATLFGLPLAVAIFIDNLEVESETH